MSIVVSLLKISIFTIVSQRKKIQRVPLSQLANRQYEINHRSMSSMNMTRRQDKIIILKTRVKRLAIRMREYSYQEEAQYQTYGGGETMIHLNKHIHKHIINYVHEIICNCVNQAQCSLFMKQLCRFKNNQDE